MTLTYAQALAKHDVPLPDGLIADAEVPVLTGAQRQGDVGIFPRNPIGAAEMSSFAPVPASGVVVVRGMNAHILDAYEGEVLWSPAAPGDGLLLGILAVPAGAVAYLTHTEEHTSNAIGPGTYVLNGKREMADEIRRVAD